MATLVVVCSAGPRSYELPRSGTQARGSVLVSDSCAEGLNGSVTSGLSDVAGENGGHPIRRGAYRGTVRRCCPSRDVLLTTVLPLVAVERSRRRVSRSRSQGKVPQWVEKSPMKSKYGAKRASTRVRQVLPLAALDEMMPVELEGIRLLRHSAFIDDGLTIVLAGRLQSGPLVGDVSPLPSPD